jgi:hypothetical protein
MPLASQIPQEIIDNIIDELPDDHLTLKSCATVSHSFLQPSRRNLFSIVHLSRGPKQIKRLHDLLTTVSDISLFIRELNIAVVDIEADKEIDFTWLKEDEILARVLGMVPRLQSLSWRTATYQCLSWEFDLSDKLRAALMDLFQSCNLATARISHLDCFPLSVLGAFTHSKKLSFSDVSFSSRGKSASHSALPQLEVLHLDIIVDSEYLNADAECFTPTSSTFPNLCCLSIESGYGNNAPFPQAQHIIASARSIERVRWCFSHLPWRTSLTVIACVTMLIIKSSLDPNAIDLGVMSNLRFLTLKCTVGGWSSFGWRDANFPLIARCLKNPQATKSLEELTIGLQINSKDSEDLGWYISKFEWWEDLDTILVPLPTLKQVLVYVDFSAAPTSTAQIQIAMDGRMALLEARGILKVVSGRINDLEKEIW